MINNKIKQKIKNREIMLLAKHNVVRDGDYEDMTIMGKRYHITVKLQAKEVK